MSLSNRFVNPSGPVSSDIMLIGEAPGKTEDETLIPFSGDSGTNILFPVLARFGLSREDVYITNLSPYRPDGNDFDLIHPDIIKNGVDRIWDTIHQYPKKIVILLGNEPLQYLGKKFSIEANRGCPLFVNNQLFLPAYHPAYVYRNRELYPIFTSDIAKALRYAKEGWRDPGLDYEFIVDPRGFEAESAVEEILSSDICAVDIESIKGTTHVLCCGFAVSDKKAYCFVNHSFSGTDLTFTSCISRILAGKTKKIFHNGLYDVEILRRNGLTTENYIFDTQYAAHSIEPELPKSLAFLASIHTDMPYYKDKGRSVIPDESDEKGWSLKASKEERDTLYEYNLKDCIATWLVKIGLEQDIKERKCEDIFDYYMSLIPLSLHLTETGLPIDEERRVKIKTLLVNRWSKYQSLFNNLAGKKVNAGSWQQLQQLFYKDLGLPVQKKYSGEITSDEKATIKLITYAQGEFFKYKTESKKMEWARILGILKVSLEIKGIRKTLSNYIEMELHPDHRARSAWKITGTDSDRWACDQYYDGSGFNAQTMPREILEYEEGELNAHT